MVGESPPYGFYAEPPTFYDAINVGCSTLVFLSLLAYPPNLHKHIPSTGQRCKNIRPRTHRHQPQAAAERLPHSTLDVERWMGDV